MKKILIVLYDDLYVRNYLTNDSFLEVEKNFDAYYLITDDVKLYKQNIESKKNYIKSINLKKKFLFLHKILYDALLIANKKKSSSFAFRFIMRFNLNFRNILRKPYYKIIFRILFRLYRSFRILSIRYPLSLIFRSRYLSNKVFNLFPVDENLDYVIKNNNFNLILIPTSGYHAVVMDIIKIARINKIMTFCLIDNWDNLSTKSIMWRKPDYIGVWGEQTKDHAVKIQDINPDKCFKIGTARYQKYFDLRKKKIKSHFNFDYALFLGTSWHWDEHTTLLKLDEIINKSAKLGNFKIIYRPHPWRQGHKTKIINYKNILYDPQILNILEGKAHNQPDLNYYPSLISNSRFVLGGPQTMMIESTIFGKNYLALVYDDEVNFSNMKTVYNSYLHFRGIEKLVNIEFCKNLNELEKNFFDIFLKKEIKIEKIDEKRQNILYHDDLNYSARLCDILTKKIFI